MCTYTWTQAFTCVRTYTYTFAYTWICRSRHTRTCIRDRLFPMGTGPPKYNPTYNHEVAPGVEEKYNQQNGKYNSVFVTLPRRQGLVVRPKESVPPFVLLPPAPRPGGGEEPRES